MKRTLTILTVIIIAAQAFICQAQRSQRLTNEDRQKWLEEMRAYKHEFLIKELSLTKEQQNAFFPIYDQMDDELNRINSEVRELEKKCIDNPNMSDEEKEAAARTIFEQKQREGNVEAAYFSKFKSILSPKQLVMLKDAERKFTQMLVKQHHGRKSK